MTLKGKPVVVTTTIKTKPETKPTFVDGETYVGFEVSYADDKGTVLDITPTRSWVAKTDNAILNQGQAKGLYVVAKRQQALISVGAPVAELDHLLDRPFSVKATPAILEWISDHAHVGGKTQVAFFKAVKAADKATRSARRSAFNKALKAELAAI